MASAKSCTCKQKTPEDISIGGCNCQQKKTEDISIDPIKQTILRCVSPINEKFYLPDAAIKCTWSADADPATSPHTKVERRHEEKIYDNVLKLVGNTPLVRLKKIPQSLGIKCEVLVKCEYFNPGGSVKDRIGLRMIEDAERAGLLKPGSTVIEPTSGNTGIGLALGCAVKGYRCIIVMSEKMSDEKVTVLRCLGAEIIRTPVIAASDSPDGLFAVCSRLKQQIPNSIILDQYTNPGNPLAHYDTTAEEILYETDGNVDMIVAGSGTGGTLTGIARKFKTLHHKATIVAVDPYGSILAPDNMNQSDVTFYEVEGVGYDFIPTVFARNIIDKWIKIGDKESFLMARRLIREEGLLVGGSSGATVAAAMKLAKDLKEDQRVVVLLPDGIRNYLTKFANDNWMEERHFQESLNTANHKWWDNKVSALPSVVNYSPVTITVETTCGKVVELMKQNNVNQLPIVDDKGDLKQLITSKKLVQALVDGQAKPNEAIGKLASNIFPKITTDSNLGLASRILQKEEYIVVVKDLTKWGPPLGILTRQDVLPFISQE